MIDLISLIKNIFEKDFDKEYIRKYENFLQDMIRMNEKCYFSDREAKVSSR